MRKGQGLLVIVFMLVFVGLLTTAAEVFVLGNLVIVLDEHGLTVYDLNGNRILSVPAIGFARILTTQDRLILIDNSGIRIFDFNGNQQGNTITINRSPRSLIINSSLIVVDSGRIRIFDLNGSQKGSEIDTEGAVTINTSTDDKFIVIDGKDRLRMYDLQGLLLATVQLPADDRPLVTSIDFPSIVSANRVAVEGSFQFEDQNGDVDFVFFSAIEAKSFTSFGFIPQVSGIKRGTIRFQITCFIPQAITARIMLVDKERHTSIPKEFTFVCQ